ncbi:jg24559, partial [Pararge aegeria aegeria]
MEAIPEITSYEDQAVDAVVSVLNKAREALGERQTLKQFA